MGTPVKASAGLTAADIFKEDTSKAKREKKEMGLHGYPRKSLRLTSLEPTFSKRIQAKLNVNKKSGPSRVSTQKPRTPY